MLMEFPEKSGSEYPAMSYLSNITVNQNGKAIARLTKESSDEEDMLLVAEAIKICPYQEFVEPLKEKISSKDVKIDSAKKIEIVNVLAQFDEKFVYTPMPDISNCVDSWRW